ncbi:MAG TPA: hypothetical protein VHS96_01450, partial [Bacteroidia bacterium]|nr:hypothetical protein [Bacteroidia bacterium]
MSLLLGIYHRGNRIQAAAVQPMVDAFARYSTYLNRRDFPGFVLLSVNEMEGETAIASGPGNEQVVGLIGTVVENGDGSLPPADCFHSAWEKRGAGCLAQLDGAFTAAVYDADAHRLSLANDKFGMRPLFFASNDDY